ncbi:MAG: hypothetical protein AAF208_09900 [Cyanobacteria bacterium P01_A01_bin.45]
MNSIKQRLALVATGAILTISTGTLPASAANSNFNSLNTVQENVPQSLISNISNTGELSVARRRRRVRYRTKRVCVIKYRRYGRRYRRIKRCRYVRVRVGRGRRVLR